jgi:hypothetical protein
MAATVMKTCQSCKEQHVFFLPMGNAAEPTRRYEYTCPKSRTRVRFEPAKTDAWRAVDGKQPGSVIVREVVVHA